MRQGVFVLLTCLLSATAVAAGGFGSLLGHPENKVIDCLMASGLMEDAAMLVSDDEITVIGPDGWQVELSGTAPATAVINARDATGRADDTLRREFRAALDKCD